MSSTSIIIPGIFHSHDCKWADTIFNFLAYLSLFKKFFQKISTTFIHLKGFQDQPDQFGLWSLSWQTNTSVPLYHNNFK